MTEMGGSGSRASRDPFKVRAETIPPTPQMTHGEVFHEGQNLVTSFYLPNHQPRDIKYHVGRRTITLWSRKEGNEFQTILVLPKWVRPETFLLTHNNGVYEFVLESANEAPKLAPNF